jgi:DHA3 family macrolide efflux protein-like MFS transporter
MVESRKVRKKIGLPGLEILEIRAFRRLWVGQAVSQFGDALYALLFLFMVDKLTGKAAMVGYVGALQAAPFLLVGPYAGVIADRFDRKRVMLFADLSSALILVALCGVLLVNSRPPVTVIFAAAFLLSLVNSFFLPAKSAAIPALVPAERLMEANALSAATQNLMPLLGIGFSGAVLGILYALYPNLFFLVAAGVNALSFLCSAACIAGLPALRPQRGDTEKRALHEMAEGFRLIWRDHVLRVSLIMGFFLNLFISPFMVAFIAVNRAWFGGSFLTLAGNEAAFMGAMVVTSLLAGKLKIARPGLSFVLGMIAVGLLVAFMGYSRAYAGFVLLNVFCGMALPFATLPLNTYIQLRVPDAFRGRVNSANSMAAQGIVPLSMGTAGLLLDRIGLTALFLLMGLGFCTTALAGMMDAGFRNARMPAVTE